MPVNYFPSNILQNSKGDRSQYFDKTVTTGDGNYIEPIWIVDQTEKENPQEQKRSTSISIAVILMVNIIISFITCHMASS